MPLTVDISPSERLQGLLTAVDTPSGSYRASQGLCDLLEMEPFRKTSDCHFGIGCHVLHHEIEHLKHQHDLLGLEAPQFCGC